MESVNLETKQAQKIDRVVLDTESIAVVQKISDQVQNELGDLVQISQKDIVNFLIQERSAELTSAEISKIKSEHFDIVRALKRATQEAIKAKQDGHEIEMDELLKIIQTPGVGKSAATRKLRGRKAKSLAVGDTDEKIDLVHGGPKTILSVKTSNPEKAKTDSDFKEIQNQTPSFSS